MPNYRIHLDLSDIHRELDNYVLYDYRTPFCLSFVEAGSPDDACHAVLVRVMKSIVKQKNDIETRILCRKIRKHYRVDKIDCL